MGSVSIIYWRYYDFNNSRKFIGGIETYIYRLSKVLLNRQVDVTIYQCSEVDFRMELAGITVVGVAVEHPESFLQFSRRNKELLYAAMKSNETPLPSMVIFATDEAVVSDPDITSLALQHGIGWDKPIRFLTSRRFLQTRFGEKVKRLRLRLEALRKFGKASYTVCVDYNYVNWLATFMDIPSGIEVILNCTELPDESLVTKKLARDRQIVRILFARRFEEFRGTRIFADAVESLLATHENISVTFAGGGSDQGWLEQKYRDEPRVLITTFDSTDAIAVNLDHDIAVIPSFGSEGSSFSVAEGMASGSAIVTTASGGITNMVITEFNGLVCKPTADGIANAVDRIIRDHDLRRRLSSMGYETAKCAFGEGAWQRRWNHFLDNLGIGCLEYGSNDKRGSPPIW